MRISNASAFSYASYSLGGQQAELAKLSAEISSGKRIMSPADDPEGAAQIIHLQDQLSRNNQLRSNQTSATTTLTQAESLLGNVDDTYTDIRSLLVQAGDPVLSNNDRQSMASELAARRDALYGLSNSRDSDGQPMFGGRIVQVGTSRELDVTLNSALLFGQVPNGNGVFATSAATTNTGNSAISVGVVTNATALDDKSYDITIHDNAGTLTYDVVDATTSTVVSTGNAFTLNTDITVAGMSVKIAGSPADGDTFHLTPSVKRSAFTGLDELVQALRTPITDDASRARLSASISAGLAQVDNASETSRMARATTGAALQELDTLQSLANSQDTQLQTQLSSVQDLDYTQAAIELSQRQLTIEAAQKAYSKTLGHSLFDFM